MTTATADSLQALQYAAIMNKTVAGGKIYMPRDWPTKLVDGPIVLLQRPTEIKMSLGRVAPQFTVTTALPLVARLTAPAVADDAGAKAVSDALAIFQRQIERAVINDYELTKAIQQFSQVEAQSSVTSEGKQHVGELVMVFHLEHYQGPEDFADIPLDPFEEMKVYFDFVKLSDPSGVYVNQFDAADGSATDRTTEDGDGRVTDDDISRETDDAFIAPFPEGVTTPPRERGPDGRTEGVLDIKIPQE